MMLRKNIAANMLRKPNFKTNVEVKNFSGKSLSALNLKQLPMLAKRSVSSESRGKTPIETKVAKKVALYRKKAVFKNHKIKCSVVFLNYCFLPQEMQLILDKTVKHSHVVHYRPSL